MPGTIENGMVFETQVITSSLEQRTPLNQKFPLIIALPGRGEERQKQSILYQELASHGYVVITMDQPYVANFVKLSDGTKYTVGLKDAWLISKDRDFRYSFDDDVIQNGINDILYLIGHFDQLGKYEKMIKKEKIIIIGHSIGANIAHQIGFSHKQFKAIVDIDSKITDRKVFGRIGIPINKDSKPVLFIRGGLQYQEDVKEHLKNVPNSTVWSPKVQHRAFLDDAYFAAKIRHFHRPGFLKSIYNLIFKTGPYFTDIDTSIGDYHVDTWFRQYPYVIKLWLDKNVK